MSHNQRPSWVYGIQRSYITGIGIDESIEMAQYKAIHDVRRKITESVYNEIVSRTELSVKEVLNEDKTYNIVYTFLEETISTSDAGVATRGISLNNASDYYYEVTKDRRSVEKKALYAIKYPFTRLELNKLINELERSQQKLTEQINIISNRIGKHKTVEDILNDIDHVIQIRERVIDNRNISVDRVLSGLYGSLNTITLQVLVERNDHIEFKLYSQGREINTNVNPTVVGKHVNIENIFQDDKKWIVNFREEGKILNTNMQPKLEISFRQRQWRVSHTHTLKPHIRVRLISPVIFHVRRYSFWGTNVNEFECLISVEVTGIGGITFERLTLDPFKITGRSSNRLSPITINYKNNISAPTGKTMHSVIVSQRLNRSEWSLKNPGLIIVNGTLFYRENITGERKSVRFSEIELKTDW